MKNLLLALPFTCITIASAQPVINETDVFNIGSTCQYAYNLYPNVSPGNSGPNQNYNFQSLTTDWTTDREIVSVQNAPHGSLISGDRVVLYNQGQDGSVYFSRSNGQLLGMGEVSEDAINPSVLYIVPNTPGELKISFPVVFTQTCSGLYENQITFYVGQDLGNGWITDSIRRRSGYRYDYAVDSWGNLQAPNTNYTALRQTTHITKYDTVDVYRSDMLTWLENFEITEVEYTIYTYWAPGKEFPVIELLDFGSDGSIEDCIWMLNGSSTGFSSLNENKMQLNVFPNPSTGTVTISTENAENASWTLLDLSGKTIQSGRLNSDREKISFAGVPAGMYLLQVRNQGATITRKFAIESLTD